MKSWTALNINEFILFDMFGSPYRRVVIFSKFARSLNMVFWRTCVKRGQCRTSAYKFYLFDAPGNIVYIIVCWYAFITKTV